MNERRGVGVVLGVLLIFVAAVNVMLIVTAPIFQVRPTTDYEWTQQHGVKVPGTITSGGEQPGPLYRVLVEFNVVENGELQHRSEYIAIRDTENKLQIPSDVTVMYLPEEKHAIFLEEYGDPERKASVNTVSLEAVGRIVLYFVGGLALIYFLGIRQMQVPEDPRYDAS